jgi:hypothetical protein
LFNFGLVLGHGQAQGRQIKHLAAFALDHGLAFQAHPAALTAGTAMQRMHMGVVWLLNGLQGVAGVTGLAAGLAPGFAAQAARRWFGQPVAGGGLATVRAVESFTILQPSDLLQQILDLFFGRQELIHHCLRVAAGLAQKFLAAT